MTLVASVIRGKPDHWSVGFDPDASGVRVCGAAARHSLVWKPAWLDSRNGRRDYPRVGSKHERRFSEHAEWSDHQYGSCADITFLRSGHCGFPVSYTHLTLP